MNAKHGAAIGMAMAAITLLGLINLTPRDAALPPAAESPAAAPADAAQFSETPVTGLALSAPKPSIGGRGIGVELAAAPGNAALAAAVLSSTVAQVTSCAQVYLDFRVNPRVGPVELTVQATCLASLVDASGPLLTSNEVVSIEWYMNATGAVAQAPTYIQTIIPEVPLGNQPQAHTYLVAGSRDVGMRLIIQNASGDFEACPPRDEPPFIKAAGPPAYITVTEPSDVPAASMDVSDVICASDSEGVLPLNDWVPLIAVQMSWTDAVARRTLTELEFRLREDRRALDDLGYVNEGPLDLGDVLEFAMFQDVGGDEGGGNQLLDGGDGRPVELANGSEFVLGGEPMLTWRNTGFPFEMPTGFSAPGVPNFSYNDTSYRLNFTFVPCDDDFNVDNEFDVNNPQFPFYTDALPTDPGEPPLGSRYRNWVTSGLDPNNDYILAVRLSPTLTSGTTIAVEVTSAQMQRYEIDALTGEPRVFPLDQNADGAPVDSYTPNFFDGEILAEECGRSANFSVWDLTGGDNQTAEGRAAGYTPGLEQNPWLHPARNYNLVPEFARPRWDQASLLFDRVVGEELYLRNVFATETWVPLIAINAHGNCTDGLTELTLVMTDVGADPYGAPGNGGFDPRTMLDPVVPLGPSGDGNAAVGVDYAFNGIWVYYDGGGGQTCADRGNCDGDGLFNVPTSNDGSGVSFSNQDTPLIPLDGDSPDWEYVPFPPGGGDPWWRIRLRFGFLTPERDDIIPAGRRRNPDEGCTGFFEPLPDYFGDTVLVGNEQPDFFVVARPDSGFLDSSLVPGDGTGMVLGADTRTFLEPLRWSPNTANYSTGLAFGQQIPTECGCGSLKAGGGVRKAFSFEGICELPDDPLALFDDFPEPYWYERTHSQDNVKPVRGGLDVHDLVMTYRTASFYAKVTNIQEGAPLTYVLDDQIGGTTIEGFGGFRLWADAPAIDTPLLPGGVIETRKGDLFVGPGIMSARFNDFGFPSVSRFVGAASQYAFETVPFDLDVSDVTLSNSSTLPRDPFFPNTRPQPTLPDYLNWPPQVGEPVNFGLSSSCFLSSEGAEANVPLREAGSNGAEQTYRDDEYVYRILDASVDLADDEAAGMWLIDREGGRFRIRSNSGNDLLLERGHSAYAAGAIFDATEAIVDIPEFPFGIPVGAAGAVRRGAWIIVRDAVMRNEYNNIEQWPNGLGSNGGTRAARLLKQYTSVNSQPTAMLGVNVTGSEDPAVNAEGDIGVNSITAAFWGPEFDRSDLAKLDRDGELFTSGVLLYQDTNGNGVFDGPLIRDAALNPAFFDTIVPLEANSLQWQLEPELVDIDGDKEADDLSGDGVVSNGDPNGLTPEELAAWDGLDDRAWVVRLQPDDRWVAPESDTIRPDNVDNANKSALGGLLAAADKALWPEFWAAAPVRVEAGAPGDGIAKDFLPATLNEGDDLFVVVRTSESVGQFEQFRCIVPSTLPERFDDGGAAAQAGIEVSPRNYPVVQSFVKSNPEEGVEDFYGHDMLAVGVPARLVDLTTNLVLAPGTGIPTVPVIEPGGPPEAVLGIDLSANRPDNLIAQGGTKLSKGAAAVEAKADGSFITTNIDPATPVPAEFLNGNDWTDAVIGFWLTAIGDASGRVEAYEITGVNGQELTLRAGAPRDGSPWQIVRDPSFLEELIVELYDTEGLTPGLPSRGDGNFDPQYDLLEMNYEDPLNGQLSGLSIYRDNDFHADNTNGQFDPPVLAEDGTVLEYIDLPVRLDDPPSFVGVQGEPQYQVRFVFSSPGTDGIADGRDVAAYETQPLLRQPIAQSFGRAINDDEFGSDFFVVMRTSRRMSEGDNFSVAIASWGPDTPSEPDPDNFRVSNIPGVPQQQVGDSFNLFQEYPFGARGIGLITFFREAPVQYFWGYDQDLRKVVARQEPDTSQDAVDPRYWVRSSPDTFGITTTVTALPSPTVDFTADRNRQQPGQPVQFTLLATGSIRSVAWDFGDGTTSTERNPSKSYASPGLYDVSVTVTDRFGISDTEFKEDYIEILEAPFADFTGSPTDGTITPDRTGALPPGLNVTFRNTSVGTDDIVPIAYFWNFGDGQTSTEAGFPTDPDDPASTDGLIVHRYLAAGIYTVSLQVTFRDTTSGTTQISTCTLRDLVTVRPCVGCPSEGEGEGEGEDPPAADFTVASQIDARDRESLLPLNDWVPLFRFTMGYGEEAENVAPRFLRTLVFTLRPDEREPEDLDYGNQGPPDFTDIEEFGLFVESFSDSDDDTVLDNANDFALFRWNSLGIADNGSPIARLISSFPLAYELDLIGNGTPEEPEFPVPAGPTGDGTIDGESYIIGMRTSATWRSQITMGVDVNFADMVVAGTGEFPVNDDGEPIDSYSPNFFDGETFEEDASYSSSFTVFDMTGRPFGDEVAVAGLGDFSLTALPNTWTNPLFIYTPAAEHTRPRWNQLTRLTELFSGEVLELRELIPIETWRPLLGINAHATKAVHYLTVDDEDPSLGRFDFEDDTLLQEVNLVFTDIGADPFGAPGNGGFDPREALERVISENYGQEPVVGRDYIYNGAWVFWDNNNNGLFDAPVALDTGGVTYSSQDRPMVPASFDGTDNGDWEYVPFPPGGGDPWWRIKLRFLGYAAQFVNEGDEPIGMLEKAPDQLSGFDDAPVFSETSFDYFVVARTDSGERDVSLQPGDGAGIKAGADFRVFIEPRRFNASTGSEDGGIYIDGMIPPIGPRLPSGGESSWQNDPRWGATEPWWPARTLSPEAAKPQRVGLEVHDLALTYESDSRYARVSDLHFGGDPFGEDQCFGYSFGLDEPTDFEQWMDPFGLRRGRFLNRHSVGVYRLQAEGRFFRALQIIGVADIENAEAFPIQYTFDTERSLGQHAFETVPFFNSDPVVGDVPPSGPRSNAFPLPPFQPAVPDYATWPGELAPGDYPRQSDWRDEDNAARLLTQKMDIESTHTPLLGFNLAGAEDPIINAAEPVQLAQMTVALWGPDFTPADLQPLDPSGQSRSSGVLLWEDQDGDGTFFDGDTIAAYNDLIQRIGGLDQVVPLRNLAWGSAPEPIDLDGDGVADDMDGNGLVDEADYAWVLRITPEDLWEVPQSDAFTLGDATGFDVVIDEIGCGTFDFGSGKDEPGIPLQRAENKALETDAPQPGDDLFLTVRTSDQAERFEKVRAVVPATLPGRSLAADRLAGVQFFPQVATDPGAFMKTSPEEDPVQDFYGHDTMEVNVPVKLVDMTNAEQNITVGGPGVPVLGLDLATNRSEGTVASGTGGLGSSGMFTVSGQAWAPNALAGDWLVDSRFETYAIVSNNATQLQLLSGTPRDGAWRIVRDPSFLEQVIVEFYNEGTNADFNPLTDLLPLNLDQRLSGVALYRDNDLDARNGNGVFDPGIDIPLNLDAAPTFVGLTGQDIQVKFVFSTPGTDDVSGGVQGGGLTLAEQTRNRQWVPDTFGARAGDRDFGPDFFVVVRASTRMSADDNFRMGIVSWGPNTPTEPDPDTWAGLPESQRNDFTKFQEFPWSSRGLGFITFFKEPPLRYFLDGNVAGQKEDTSGFDWLRSHTSKKRRTGVITARQEPDSPFALRIDGGSPKLQLPTQTLPGQPFEFVLRGKGFGANPSVVISGYDVEIVAATDTAITLRVSTRPGAPPQEPIVVIVRNPDTNREASRDDIFTLAPGTADRAPSVTGLSPARANELLFPVTVTGADFPDGASLEVYFGATRMPVLSSTATGIVVGFPAGGFPGPGQYDVTVRNTAAGTQGVLVGGFTFENKPRKPGPNILGCGAAPEPGAGAPWGDAAAMLGALALLAAAALRRRGTAGA